MLWVSVCDTTTRQSVWDTRRERERERGREREDRGGERERERIEERIKERSERGATDGERQRERIPQIQARQDDGTESVRVRETEGERESTRKPCQAGRRAQRSGGGLGDA